MLEKKNNCLFVGNYYIQEILDKYQKEYDLSLGNDNYEKKFLEILGIIYKKITVITFPSLPINKKNPISTKSIVVSNDSKTTISLGFKYTKINFFLNKKKNIKREMIKLININKDIDCIFLSTYNHFSLISFIKSTFPHIKVVLLLPDLPNIFIGSTGGLYRLRMRMLWCSMHRNINKFDVVLPITEFELNSFKKQNFKTFVYETFFDASIFDGIEKKWKKQLLYAGSINRAYGIKNLIESYIKSNSSSEYRLIICGNGDYKNELCEIVKNNGNIDYLGSIPHEQVLKLERESTLLVVPDNDARPFSFHSRYLEYFSSGTPVMSYIPVGAKKEYKKFIYKIDKKYEDFSYFIDKAIYEDLDYLKKQAQDARNYMLNERNINYFASNIYKVIYE